MFYMHALLVKIRRISQGLDFIQRLAIRLISDLDFWLKITSNPDPVRT